MAESETEFERIVDGYLSEGVLGERVEQIMRAFEVPQVVVKRWAEGTARPHPRIQRQVVAFIKERSR